MSGGKWEIRRMYQSFKLGLWCLHKVWTQNTFLDVPMFLRWVKNFGTKPLHV